MKTIRKCVFETNSSSTHSISCYKKRRNPTDFNLPDENGVLTIRMSTYWSSDLNFDDEDHDAMDVNWQIEYLAAQSIISTTGYDYSTKNLDPLPDSSLVNQEDLLKVIKLVYKRMKLPEVKSIRLVTELSDGSDYEIKVPLEPDFWDRNGQHEWESNAEFGRRKSKCTKANKLMFKHCIGVTANDLTDSSLVKAFMYFSYDELRGDDGQFKPFCDAEKKNHEKLWHADHKTQYAYFEKMIAMVLTHESMLDFFHT